MNKEDISKLIEIRKKKHQFTLFGRVVTIITMAVMSFIYFVPTDTSVRQGLGVMMGHNSAEFQAVITLIEMGFVFGAAYILFAEKPDFEWRLFFVLSPIAVVVLFSAVWANTDIAARFLPPVVLGLLFINVMAVQVLLHLAEKEC